jgi:hypothetical protein
LKNQEFFDRSTAFPRSQNDLADFDKNDLLDIMESAFLIKNKY